MKRNDLFTEDLCAGNRYREEQYQQLVAAVAEKRKKSDTSRAARFEYDFRSVDSFLEGQEKYRAEFIGMLGWPLTEYSSGLPIPEATVEYVAEDSLGKIYRLNIQALRGITTYGLLFLPNTDPPYPLVISQHGGSGTPELCSGFFGSANYNDMTRRVLRRGFAVFAPQMFLWGNEFGPEIEADRQHIDSQLKQLGGSITALELCKLMRSIDYLHARNDIIAEKTGMIGLSYGGFYTLFAAAADVRIRAAVSSCFFNNRFIYDWDDWTWFNSSNLFLDGEVCSLICPRPLYIEVADKDENFNADSARQEYQKVESLYQKLGYAKNAQFHEFHGGHELDKEDGGINFLCDQLKC